MEEIYQRRSIRKYIEKENNNYFEPEKIHYEKY